MRNTLILALIALTLVPLVGCVERTITITSEPDGALVWLNDEEVGRTPLSVPFTFYGVYDVRVSKDGYQTLNTSQRADAPLKDTLGIDLFTEMAPWTERINLQWHFQLDQAQPVDESLTVDRARQLKAMLENEAPVQPATADQK